MKYFGRKIIRLFVALGILLLAGGAGAVTQIDSCTVISAPGEYVLNQSIINSPASTCIAITSSNVIFDGASYTIDGVDSFANGVYVYNSTTPLANVTIKNLIVTDWYYGIYYYNVLNGRIENNIASSNRDGIFLKSSSSNVIHSNTANSNGFGGIHLRDSSNDNVLTNNTANFNSYRGIALYTSSDRNNLSGNTVNSNGESGFYLYSSSNNNISGNTVNSNAQSGITMYQMFGNNLVYNNVFNNTNNFKYDSMIWSYGQFWNTEKTSGVNIVGGPYLGGNFWAYPNGTGFSQTCPDANGDGICDSSYQLEYNNADNFPLSLNFTLPSHVNSVGYSATVATGQNTYVQSSNGTFGLLLKGQSKTINNSVILNNTGDISAKVEARFNDSIAGVFGLISGVNVLNATNFALGTPGVLVPLSSLGADVQVAIAPPGVTALDARLGVPNEQAAGDYSGTVIMTFSNNI